MLQYVRSIRFGRCNNYLVIAEGLKLWTRWKDHLVVKLSFWGLLRSSREQQLSASMGSITNIMHCKAKSDLRCTIWLLMKLNPNSASYHNYRIRIIFHKVGDYSKNFLIFTTKMVWLNRWSWFTHVLINVWSRKLPAWSIVLITVSVTRTNHKKWIKKKDVFWHRICKF